MFINNQCWEQKYTTYIKPDDIKIFNRIDTWPIAPSSETAYLFSVSGAWLTD